ncbi:zf-CCHC domain-containing protein/UBN2 domain-containing protein [Gossypium australe]|uniref:Zf-CCHC domain-containing protein/UBN2 domain-containing protein n=1 Tax=Gossypium australe TaxID=47621 RepID=A0A5B6VMA5_9ROSI|nr:zf-CCHC domain-containing protein/UBN2 domain-containing protein [Gossypium australe]
MHTLFCALGLKKYSKVSSCFNANEIWDKIKVTHECTSQVKKSKVRILTLNYETFKMKPGEDIKVMFDRFTTIINGLKSYGKIYLNKEEVRKMLRSLPKLWEAKVTIIEEVNNLETLILDELIGSLLTHELRRKFQKKKRLKLKSNKEKYPIICYECKKLGHIKFDYPQWKKNGLSKQKLKAHIATWSDENSFDDED